MAAVGQQSLAGSQDTALLYERHQRRVFSYCLWRLGKREDAEDATQTTFLNAHRALAQGTRPTSESSWLLTIAHNVCLARWRSQKSRPPELAAEPETLTAVAAPEHDPQLVARLQGALAKLPECQRRAFVLREWQGLSYAEIATELDTTETAVAALVFRARRALMESLSDERRPSRLVGSLNVGSILGWLKSLLGGTAAKLVIAGTVVGVAGLTAGFPLVVQHPKPALKLDVARVSETPARSHQAVRPDGQKTGAPHKRSHRSAVTRAEPRRAGTAPTKPSAAPVDSGSVPSPEASASSASTPPAASPPERSAPISIRAPEPASVTGAVTGVVGAVQQVVPPVQQLLPVAPPSLPPAPKLLGP